MTVGAYEADKQKVRNVAPVGELLDELGRQYETRTGLPKPPPREPRLPPLLDRAEQGVREAVQQAPSVIQRARQFLRSEEEKKLMGGS